LEPQVQQALAMQLVPASQGSSTLEQVRVRARERVPPVQQSSWHVA